MESAEKFVSIFRNVLLVLVAVACMVTGQAFAATVFQTGTGAVTTVDRLATFNSLSGYGVADLSTYTESDLKIQTQVSVPNYILGGGIWYPNGGATNGTLDIIGTTDGARMSAIEFQSYAGNSTYFTNLIWQTYRDGVLVGNGSTLLSFSNALGPVLGWSDSAGIDELRVGLFNKDGLYPLVNPLGIDNLKVQLAHISPTPLPASLPLFLTMLGGMGFLKRRRDKRQAA